MLGSLPGVLGSLPGVLGSLPGVLGSLPGVLGSLPGVLGSLPGVLGSLPGVLGSLPGVLGSLPGVVGSDATGLVAPGAGVSSAYVGRMMPAETTAALSVAMAARRRLEARILFPLGKNGEDECVTCRDISTHH
ncbi:hypothetical protein [Actinomyces bouchesdurhonensis]|uniref:hypothetical protein n=1 Tax=Actinomyces bouchesdurhonensis TaxID=1852361 RepID=UPI00135664D6|nr:hypothetical protein [Actinomyces bouchesdurhonensis]